MHYYCNFFTEKEKCSIKPKKKTEKSNLIVLLARTPVCRYRTRRRAVHLAVGRLPRDGTAAGHLLGVVLDGLGGGRAPDLGDEGLEEAVPEEEHQGDDDAGDADHDG